jgi:putative PEP-CTERM system TPR-repeat lipoprotein
MKKKYLLVVLAILLLGSGTAGGAWYWHRAHDQLGIARAAMARGDLRTAQIALRAMVRDRPQSAEAHYRLGAVQMQFGDPVAAEKELKLAQAAGWSNRVVMPLLARTYLAQGRFKEAKEIPVEGLGPEEAGPLLVTRALAELGLKEMSDAQTTATEAERLAPNIVEAPLAAARVALARNDTAVAELKINRALEINPRSVDALLLKGEMQQAHGNYEAAVAAFTEALAIAPDAINIRLERANTLISLNQGQKAREDVDAALLIDARNPLANYFLTVLLVRAGDWQGADTALQKISPVISRFPRGEYFQALVKINLNQFEQAADAANKYVARMSQDIAGYKLLARIYARAHRPQQMIAALMKASDAGLVDVELLELLGNGYVQTGQIGLALQTLDKAARLASDDADVLSRIAAIRLGIGDAGGAERNLARSLELTPDKAGLGEQLVMAALAAGDIDQAAAELDKLRRQPTSDPAKLGNLLGLVRMGQLDLDGARVALEGALAADPTSIAARLNLAKVLAQQGRGADAEKLLLPLLDKDPANAPALSAIGGILLAQNQPDRLIALMEAGHRAAPGNAGLTLAMADLLVNTGETRKAYALLDALPKEQAALPGVLAARARLQQTLGMDQEALASYRQVLVANPADVETRRRLADLLVRAKDVAGAKEVLRKGLEVSPGNPSLLQTVVATDFRTGGLDAALATAAALAKDRTNLPAARMLKGGLYAAVQRYADAAAAYQAELDANPSSMLTVATAVALNAAGRPADARRLLQNWLLHEPKDLDVLRTLSSFNLQDNHTAEAEENLKAVLALQPGDPVALNNLAWIYQSRDDPRARAMAQKGYLLAPGPQSADTLGWILTKQGDTKTAVLLLTQAVRNLSGDPTIFYHLAVALNAAGEKDRAVGVLTQLVNSPAEFSDKQAARTLLQTLAPQAPGGAKP